MDGLNFFPTAGYPGLSQEAVAERTLKSSISCSGVGLHTGCPVAVRLLPAAAGSGVVFRRTDLGDAPGIEIPARFDAVVDTRMCTVLGSADGQARVGTVEHLMAALSACGVDNALIEIDGPEVPVFDGSSDPWLFLIDCAGTVAVGARRVVVDVLRTVRVTEGDAYAELRAGVGAGLEMAVSIAFEAAAIGAQALTLRLDDATFRRELACARTFAQKHEIEGLQAAGLARGGSLDNAVVVDGALVLNPAGLRMENEFVRHKALDAVGDLALAGAGLRARFVGHKSGHALNNRVLHALFADAANYRLVVDEDALLAA